jgi:purine-binding chemotaxis protein CheW
MAVEAIAGVPAFIRGVAVIRGVPMPVVDAGLLLTGVASHPTRFVTVKTGSGRLALAVDAVVGVVEMSPGSLDVLPPMLRGAGLDAVSAIGRLDADLLLVLQSGRLIPEELWAGIDAGCALV